MKLGKGVLIRKSEMKEMIENTFNPDPRTVENYMKCLIDFSVQNGKPINASYSEIYFNMRGFLDTVRRYLNEKIC